jgi:hypothetical protein
VDAVAEAEVLCLAAVAVDVECFGVSAHRQIQTSCGGEGLVVLVRGGDVVVAGQSVEVFGLVVIERGFDAHAPVDGVEVGEEVIGDRVEHHT